MCNPRFLEQLAAFDVAALRETLSNCPAPPNGSLEPLIESSVRWVVAMRDELSRTLKEIDDDGDAAMALAIQYVELKSKWIALNTKMNYSMFRTGACEIGDMCRGSAVSQLLAHIEPLLDDKDIEKITEFLAQPLSNAA